MTEPKRLQKSFIDETLVETPKWRNQREIIKSTTSEDTSFIAEQLPKIKERRFSILTKRRKSICTKNKKNGNSLTREMIRSKSKHQRIDNYNQGRLSLNKFQMKKSTMNISDDEVFEAEQDRPTFIFQSEEEDFGFNQVNTNNDSVKKFEQFLNHKTSANPYNGTEDASSIKYVSSCSSATNVSKSLHSIGTVIVNRRIPHFSLYCGAQSTPLFDIEAVERENLFFKFLNLFLMLVPYFSFLILFLHILYIFIQYF